MPLASDIFTIVSAAMIQTGNNPPVVAYDGTDEWIAGQNAYQIWLPYCLEAKDWSFQRQTGSLARLGPAAWLGFSDAYAFPANCLHLITVWRSDTRAQTTPPPPSGESPPEYVWQAPRAGLFPLEYKIIGNTIQTNAPNGLSGEWLTIPAGTDQYSASFTAALIAYVASSIYASLNEDLESAEKTFQVAEGLLDRAALRVAAQQNRRVPFLAATLAADPFTIISSALIQVGRQPPVSSWDGTDDWIDGWNAYQIWLPYCLEARDWNFQTVIAASLVRVGNATYPRFSDAFAIPADCIHLQTVWRPDLAAQMIPYLGWGMLPPAESIHPPQIEYRIVGSTIETTAPKGLSAKYFTNPSNADSYPATFNLALAAFVASSLFKDLAAAQKMEAKARQLLQEAASRSDQQENRRVAFRSRMLERRRARYAPWGTL